jgi:hypothetical protein
VVGKPNFTLKGALIERFGTITRAAQEVSSDELEIDQFRLSRLIHGRATARPEERRIIAWKLQRPISEIFPE